MTHPFTLRRANCAVAADAGTKYTAQQIARELEYTASGQGYYGNALRVAKDIPGVTPEERALLDRYATARNSGTDHVALATLALRINQAARNPS